MIQLQRKDGVVHIVDPATGELVESLKKFYISKEKFLGDAEKISLMMVDGPLSVSSFFFIRNVQEVVLLPASVAPPEQVPAARVDERAPRAE